jgi:proline racemase
LYKSDPGTCTGTPDLGPVSVDVADGGRAFVLVYGADATHLKLLALPIAS